jgi:hypothetical protein
MVLVKRFLRWPSYTHAARDPIDRARDRSERLLARFDTGYEFESSKFYNIGGRCRSSSVLTSFHCPVTRLTRS